MPTAEHFRNLDNSKLPQAVKIEYRRDVIHDESPDLSHLEQDYGDEGITARARANYRAADAKRLAAYHRGDWYMTGLRVTATVLVPIGGNSFTRFELSSAGIWGVESDCGDKYREELFADQETELKSQMRIMGAAFNPETALFVDQFANFQPYVWGELDGYTDEQGGDAINSMNDLIASARAILGLPTLDKIGEQEQPDE